MKSLFTFLIFITSLGLLSNPIFKRNLTIGIDNDRDGFPDRDTNCKASDIYDGNTAVSFWGDSRIDLVDNTFYGNSSLDLYLEASGWNVQNFGVSGRQSLPKQGKETEYGWISSFFT